MWGSKRLARHVRIAGWCLAGALLASCAMFSSPTQSAKPEYVVLTHPANTEGESGQLMRDVVRKIFLKQRAYWPNGRPAKALVPPEGSAARMAFIEHVVAMSPDVLEEYWQFLARRTGETPPEVVEPQWLMLERLRTDDGAFGIVTKEAASDTGHDLVVLFSFP